jgi:hypothetical protein
MTPAPARPIGTYGACPNWGESIPCGKLLTPSWNSSCVIRPRRSGARRAARPDGPTDTSRSAPTKELPLSSPEGTGGRHEVASGGNGRTT